MMTKDEEAVEGLLKILRIRVKSGGRKLTHRDYLGSVLALGLDRSVTGDILVREDGADMIIVPEMADFLLNEYRQVAHSDVSTEICDPSEIIIPENRTQTISDTVPSLRLDNVVSSAFRTSRKLAADAIKSGLVSVDHLEVTKTDAHVEEGVVLVWRGKGKAKLTEIGGESKKGRTYIKVERYIG